MKSTIRTTPLLPKARSLPKTLGRPKANGLPGRPKEPSAFLQMNRRLKSLRLKMALAAALRQNEWDAAEAQNAENGAECQQSGDARVAKASEAVTVASADELPTTIEAGATVKLAANISLSSGQ